MKFEKGQKRPEKAGRRVGAKNKATVAKEQLLELANAEKLLVPFAVEYRNSARFSEDVDALEPKDRLDFWLKCLRFFCPLPQSVNMEIRSGEDKGGLLDLLWRLDGAGTHMTAEDKEE